MKFWACVHKSQIFQHDCPFCTPSSLFIKGQQALDAISETNCQIICEIMFHSYKDQIFSPMEKSHLNDIFFVATVNGKDEIYFRSCLSSGQISQRRHRMTKYLFKGVLLYCLLGPMPPSGRRTQTGSLGQDTVWAGTFLRKP